jgi:regulator of RNase E activity RraA
MPLWNDDNELFALVREELFTAVVGDVMDAVGLLHQFLPPGIRPLHPDMVVIGRAMPVLAEDLPEDAGSSSESNKPFGLMLDALDDLRRNEVYVNSGPSPRMALWGELMSTRATKLGASGVVLDGYSRDTHAILAMRFPTFSRGSYAQDIASRARVVDFRVSVTIEAISIHPGDIIFGDIDGVLCVPQEAADEVFARALEKMRGEKKVRDALLEGSSAVDAFAKFGIM